MGPLLFIMYTSDLSKIISRSNCNHHLYADDTQVYIKLTSGTANPALTHLQECLIEVKNFMTANLIRPHLDLPVAKTAAMALISSRLDYCNSLLACLEIKDLNKLSHIQKILCRLVTKIPQRLSVSQAIEKNFTGYL